MSNMYALERALKLMLHTCGFSAKKTSGFWIVEQLEKDNVEVFPGNKKDYLSFLYSKLDNMVRDGAHG